MTNPKSTSKLCAECEFVHDDNQPLRDTSSASDTETEITLITMRPRT